MSSLNFPKFKEINCFDTDEVAGLDSTDIVDEYTTDCVVIDEPRNDAKVRLGFYFPHKYCIKHYQ